MSFIKRNSNQILNGRSLLKRWHNRVDREPILEKQYLYPLYMCNTDKKTISSSISIFNQEERIYPDTGREIYFLGISLNKFWKVRTVRYLSPTYQRSFLPSFLSTYNKKKETRWKNKEGRIGREGGERRRREKNRHVDGLGWYDVRLHFNHRNFIHLRERDSGYICANKAYAVTPDARVRMWQLKGL